MIDIEKAREIQGWMFIDELEWLADSASRSSEIVEFGCYKGRSTRALADNTPGRVYAVDPWNDFYPDTNGKKHAINPDVYPEFEKNLKDHILSGKVIPVKEFSYLYKHNSFSTPDFVFIDGDHRYETVKSDIILGQQLLKHGGILAGHDYYHTDWPGVRKAVDELLPNFNRINSIWWVLL